MHRACKSVHAGPWRACAVAHALGMLAVEGGAAHVAVDAVAVRQALGPVPAVHVGALRGRRVVVVAHAMRQVVRPLPLVGAAVRVQCEPLPAPPPRLEAAVVAAAARQPHRAAPVPRPGDPIAFVLLPVGHPRDAAPRAHAARKLAVVPLAAAADVAATAVRPQRVVELAVVLGAVCPAVDAVRQLVVGPLALDLVGLGGGGRARGMGYGVWGWNEA